MGDSTAAGQAPFPVAQAACRLGKSRGGSRTAPPAILRATLAGSHAARSAGHRSEDVWVASHIGAPLCITGNDSRLQARHTRCLCDRVRHAPSVLSGWVSGPRLLRDQGDLARQFEARARCSVDGLTVRSGGEHVAVRRSPAMAVADSAESRRAAIGRDASSRADCLSGTGVLVVSTAVRQQIGHDEKHDAQARHENIDQGPPISCGVDESRDPGDGGGNADSCAV